MTQNQGLNRLNLTSKIGQKLVFDPCGFFFIMLNTGKQTLYYSSHRTVSFGDFFIPDNTPKLLECQSALQSKIARSFGVFTPNWSENSKSLHTPIQNRPEFWSGKLHGVPLQIACISPTGLQAYLSRGNWKWVRNYGSSLYYALRMTKMSMATENGLQDKWK